MACGLRLGECECEVTSYSGVPAEEMLEEGRRRSGVLKKYRIADFSLTYVGLPEEWNVSVYNT